MKVLVACEESQRVCISFRERGHEAYSCDIQDQSGGRPEWHIMQDVLPLLNGNCEFETTDGVKHKTTGKWDLIIAHPPCTYLSNAGACRLYPRKRQLNEERYRKGMQAKEFFMSFINADCDRICVENSTPMTIWNLPKYTQAIQPYFFGEPFKKRTCLWLKGLKPLEPTNIVENAESTTVAGSWFNRGGQRPRKKPLKNFLGHSQSYGKSVGVMKNEKIYGSDCEFTAYSKQKN